MTAAAPMIAVGSARELVDLFTSGSLSRVRLCGTGSQQARLGPVPPEAGIVSLRALDRIESLAAADLTCSVQPGVRREVLDAELARRGVELPLAGGGSIGGLFALDLCGAEAPGGPSPRTLLLGMSGVLAEGLAFKSGARVVKSVAGFDVHKLLVGSRGTLFAATLLHLKLRPRPQASVCFRLGGLDHQRAIELFRTLRLLPLPPRRLFLRRRPDASFAVTGTVAGRTSFVRACLLRHELPEAEGPGAEHLEGGEVVGGSLPPSRLPALLAALPASAPLLARGGGRFEVALTPPQADALLAVLPSLDGVAAVVLGARTGHGTPRDTSALRIEAALQQRLDPRGVLV